MTTGWGFGLLDHFNFIIIQRELETSELNELIDVLINNSSNKNSSNKMARVDTIKLNKMLIKESKRELFDMKISSSSVREALAIMKFIGKDTLNYILSKNLYQMD